MLELDGCVAVTLPGPPRELQALWPAVLETEPLRRLLARRGRPARRVLRFYGVGESAVAQALAAAGGDGDGVEVTICARDFEIHVDLFVAAGRRGAGRRARGGVSSSRSRRTSSARTEASIEELVLDALPRARADARDGRVVHRRARRRRG